jgi:cyanate lyase
MYVITDMTAVSQIFSQLIVSNNYSPFLIHRLQHSPHLPEDQRETERRVLDLEESLTLSSRAVDLAEAVETDTEKRPLLKRLYKFLSFFSKTRFD